MSKIDPDLSIDHRELVICDKIGTGTFGEVWRAKWGNAEVAVKKLNVKGAKAEEVKKLIEELHTLLKVRHPLVLCYYGVCEVGASELWIVMEYANGRNLHLSLQSSPVPAIRDHWMADALRAVAYLHKKNIIHKGIKSTNFLIVNGALKVADFGMETAAKIRRDMDSLKTDPRPPSYYVGRWLAPECTEPYAHTMKSDVFALGMVLWELSHRTLPFPEISKEEDVIKAIHDKQRPRIAPECGSLQKEWIEKCWDHDPSNRPAVVEILKKLATPLQQPQFHYRAYKDNRKYFEINIAELNNMKPDKIETLTVPPKYPGNGPLPYIPNRVDIYTLLPPPKAMSTHMLDSEKYEFRLFKRVEEYFQRFYVPTDPSLEAIIESVQVISNTVLEQQFEHENDIFCAQFKGLAELREGEMMTNLDKEYLQHLLISKNLKGDQNSNPISAWHGVSPDKFESISWYGLINDIIERTDDGYFGRGIYFTQKPSYGELYANLSSGQPALGKSSLLLCWVLLGRPWPATQIRMGGGCKPGFTSHYVIVANKKPSRRLFATDKEFEDHQNTTSYYPVEENEQPQGDEIVVFRNEQVLPKFNVNYIVKKKDEVAAPPSASAKQVPTTTAKQVPTTTAKQDPTTIPKRVPTITAEQDPTTTPKRVPTITAEQDPTTIPKQVPTTTAKQDPTTTPKRLPTTVTTQRKVNLEK